MVLVYTLKVPRDCKDYVSNTVVCIGVVMYQTSPDEPGNVVRQLHCKHSSEAVLLGEYSVDGNKVHTQ